MEYQLAIIGAIGTIFIYLSKLILQVITAQQSLKRLLIQGVGAGVEKRVEASVRYEGKTVPTIIGNGRMYVQVRELAELLGLKVFYDNTTKTMTLSK